MNRIPDRVVRDAGTFFSTVTLTIPPAALARGRWVDVDVEVRNRHVHKRFLLHRLQKNTLDGKVLMDGVRDHWKLTVPPLAISQQNDRDLSRYGERNLRNGEDGDGDGDGETRSRPCTYDLNDEGVGRAHVCMRPYVCTTVDTACSTDAHDAASSHVASRPIELLLVKSEDDGCCNVRHSRTGCIHYAASCEFVCTDNQFTYRYAKLDDLCMSFYRHMIHEHRDADSSAYRMSFRPFQIGVVIAHVPLALGAFLHSPCAPCLTEPVVDTDDETIDGGDATDAADAVTGNGVNDD